MISGLIKRWKAATMRAMNKHNEPGLTPQSTLTLSLKKLTLIGLLSLGGFLKSGLYADAQLPGRSQPQAIASARVEQRQQQVRQVRPESYDLSQFPVSDRNERYWRNILWTTAVVAPQESYVAEAIGQILSLTTRPGLSRSQQRTVDMAMQVGTQLYLKNPSFYAGIGASLSDTLNRSRDPEWTAMALSALAKGGMEETELRQLTDRLRQRFPRWQQNLALKTTLRDVEMRLNPTPTPPLSDLLNWEIAPRQAHLYVICQTDRAVLCQTILKDRNGQFFRQNDQLWSVPLLLQSIHGLGWNFTRGNTPQGVYRIEGTVPQPDDEFFRAYGQFSLVKLFVPFETGLREFLPGRRGAFTGSIAAYRQLLPPSWRNYWPIEQSYWAGKAGRGLFRIHGSGEAPDFFSGKPDYPESYNWNPTIGCLSALELYDESGNVQQADMPRILNAFSTVAGKGFSGYLVVVEVPGEGKAPIPLERIEAAIRGQDTPRRAGQPTAVPQAGNSVGQPTDLASQPTEPEAPQPLSRLPIAY